MIPLLEVQLLFSALWIGRSSVRMVCLKGVEVINARGLRGHLLGLIIGAVALSSAPVYAQGIINTVAGGIADYTGGVAVDFSGNLYIADSENHRIYKVTPGGQRLTVAGADCYGLCSQMVPHAGFSGDGGQAILALLRAPSGVCLDAVGNLYIVAAGNQRIRKIVQGIITTVAGNGRAGFSGDGGPATMGSLFFNRYTGNCAVDRAGNLYIPDTMNNRIRKVGIDGIISTFAIAAWPGSVAVDEEFAVYFNDEEDVIVKVDSNGRRTIVATGLNVPAGVTVDRAGNVYIADSHVHRVRKVKPNGEAEIVAGSGDPVYNPIDGYYFTGGYSGDGGPATSARLNFPWGVAVDTAGNVFIADSRNHSVRKVVFESTFPATVLMIDSKYCVGSSWTLTVKDAAPNSSARLLGISNGQSWEIPEWRRTDGNGNFTVSGTFAEGTQGDHTLNVQIGGVFSSPVSFTVSNCQQPVITAVVNAGGLVSALVPGSIVSIFGRNLSNVTGIVKAEDETHPPRQISGTRVIVHGTNPDAGGGDAPIFFVSNINGQEQITIQIPFDVIGLACLVSAPDGCDVSIVVVNNGIASRPVVLNSVAYRP